MPHEATKLYKRWERNEILNRYLSGRVLDVGCGDSRIRDTAVGFDKQQGDGQLLAGVPNESYDTVFSSHFLEHIPNPLEGLLNQWRVLKPGGYLIIYVPDEDLYEQGCWPSQGNTDHKHTFTISKDETWSPASRNITDLIQYLPRRKVISMRIIDTNYDYDKLTKGVDQTGYENTEAAIEVIIQKAPPQLKLCSHTLQYFILCPLCQRAEMTIQGLDKNNRLSYFCAWCGDVAAMGIGNGNPSRTDGT